MESQRLQRIWLIVLSALIITIIGGGVFYICWQKAQVDILRKEIQGLHTQNEKFTGQNKVPVKNLLEGTTKSDRSYKTSVLCTGAPATTPIGSDEYPIDAKYNGLGFLGQLFTAYPCGPERVSKIFGEGDYTTGSTIWLKNNPSQSLINTFISIGFICGEESSDVSCKEWRMLNPVKLDALMKLEPYYENFKADDCIHCG